MHFDLIGSLLPHIKKDGDSGNEGIGIWFIFGINRLGMDNGMIRK